MAWNLFRYKNNSTEERQQKILSKDFFSFDKVLPITIS